MISFAGASLYNVVAHQVGNATHDEPLLLAKAALKLDEELKSLVSRYFFNSFQGEETFVFDFSNGDFTMNPLYTYSSQVFKDRDSLYIQSVNIAKHLYECSQHPQVKAGDFYVAYIENLETDEGMSDAIGLFKAENKQQFLKLCGIGGNYELSADQGIQIDKLDKGALIVNMNDDSGYRVYIVDKSGKGSEAQYWKHDFLQVKPLADSFHFTHNFLDLTKQFVTKELPVAFEVPKTDQIDILNRSVAYFKNNDTFNQASFEEEVFGNQDDVVNQFRKFGQNYEELHNLDIADEFEISTSAVKKQARVFKSVLKLDKNFHIYIHGNRDLIEKGTDPDTGKKFYKIYFDYES